MESLAGDPIVIEGGDARHIALSLRMKQGEELILCDGKGTEAVCAVASLCPESVVLDVKERRASETEPKTRVTLYQALPKSDKLEYIVQKAVELGVYRIVPVLTSRCISRPDEKTAAKKRERLCKIAAEAAKQSGMYLRKGRLACSKQSGRGIIPEVDGVLTFKNAVKEMSTAGLPIFFFEHASLPLRKYMEKYTGGDIAVMVGAEGGFSDEEAAFAEENGLLSASLGPRILRCETAPVAALAAIMYAAGEMEIL